MARDVYKRQHLGYRYGADAHLGAVKHGLFALVQEHHLPVMRDMVLAPRGRPGISHKAHGNPGQHKRLHDLAHGLLIPGRGLLYILRHGLQRGAHHLHNALAIILAIDDLRHFPVRQAGILAENICNACQNHGHGRLA